MQLAVHKLCDMSLGVWVKNLAGLKDKSLGLKMGVWRSKNFGVKGSQVGI